MRKYILFIVFLLLIPIYLWATDGVNTVEHPAKVNSVATPDKVSGVSGLAAGNGGPEISDDFSSDTSADYDVEAGGLTIAGGVASGSSWANSVIRHETAITSANMYAQADCINNGATGDYSGVMIREADDDSDKYKTWISAGNLKLYDGNSDLVRTYDGSYGNGPYTIKLSASGSSNVAVKVYVDDVLRIDATDSQGSPPSALYAGFIITRGYGNGAMTIDNFEASAL